MTEWSFVAIANGSWYWRRERVVDGVRTIDRGRFFELRQDCIADAVMHGLRAQDEWRVPGRESAHVSIACEQ